MPKRIRRLLMQVGSFVLAGLLLYLALRGVDLGEIDEAFREADYRWLLPLLGVALASIALRAWRWQVLLEALPHDAAQNNRSDRRLHAIPFLDTLRSLFIGYMVNYAAPRLGEVARTANLSAQSELQFSSVFGTVVVERVLDVVVLTLALLSVIPILWSQLPALERTFVDPALARMADWPLGFLAALVGGLLALAAATGWWLHRAMQQQSSALRQLWTNRMQPALISFREGIATLWRAPRRGVLVGSTLAMWGCYALMAYWPFIMLGTATPFGISLLDAWALMAIGALGVVVPSPGGTGSYHFITTEALVVLFAMPRAEAATYAVLTHAAQLVLFVAGGLLCLVWQGVRPRDLTHPHPTNAEPTGAKPPAASSPPNERMQKS